MLNFKGTMSEIKGPFCIWGNTLECVEICYSYSMEALAEEVNIYQTISDKINMINDMDKEDVRLLLEKESGEKVSNIKIVRLAFDFVEPEDGKCSVDLYLRTGNLFNRFAMHLRLHGETPRLEFCGLS